MNKNKENKYSVEPDYSARKFGHPIVPIEERIMSNIIINEFSGCWEWQGSKHNGYGRIIVGSRKDNTRCVKGAHRVAYEIWRGIIPDGYKVCHKCDNPSCVNPDHLFVGTRQDNVNDRENKNRNVVKVGEEQPRSKLTKSAVKNARWERAYKGTSFQELANKYGVSKQTMMNAIKGKTWKCVPYMPELLNVGVDEK